MRTDTTKSLPEIAHARLSDGIKVIFDLGRLSSSASPRSRSSSRSSHGSSHGSSSSHSLGSSRRPPTRKTHRRCHRSSSSSSSSASSKSPSRPRSRSHPRCHRNSSRCRCDRHHRSSPGRRGTPDRSSHRRSCRSRSRSSSQRRTNKKSAGQYRCLISRSPSTTSKIHKSRSRSSGNPAFSLSMDEKKELLRTAAANASEIRSVERLMVPERVKPILGEHSVYQPPTPELDAWVRAEPVPEKTLTQILGMEPGEEVLNQKICSKRIISFSIHNSVAKPTVAFHTGPKVTSRVDSIESRKPYGHWVPVKKTHVRRRAPTTSR